MDLQRQIVIANVKENILKPAQFSRRQAGSSPVLTFYARTLPPAAVDTSAQSLPVASVQSRNFEVLRFL